MVPQIISHLLLGMVCTMLVVTVLADEYHHSIQYCQGKPADVIFVLDSSGSIWGPDFDKQRNFVRNVVGMFDISANMTRVGAFTYSNWVYPEFHLNDYETKKGVSVAINQIGQTRGDTNTAGALEYARRTALIPRNGARSNVPHIIIVMTDGKSNIPIDTFQEADRLKGAGTHIFAIGIGNQVDKRELRAVASRPLGKYVFRVENFDALESIKDLLAIEACKVTNAPPTLPPPSPIDQACGDVNAADIVFAITPTASQENTDKALEFFKSIANDLEIDKDKVRVGLVPKECNTIPGLGLEELENKDSIMAMIEEIENKELSPASTLQYMRRVSFSKLNGARSHARKLGLIVLDDTTTNLKHTAAEAMKAKTLKNIEIFVVSIGKNTRLRDLDSIASRPFKSHVFQLESYDELIDLSYLVRKAMCPFEYVPSS